MASFEKGNKIGNRFKKGVVANPKGRPKKFITTLKELGYKNSEVNDTISVLCVLNEAELKKVSEDESATILEKTISKALLNGARKGSLWNLMSVLERAHGKPKESVEINQTGPVKVVWNLRAKINPDGAENS